MDGERTVQRCEVKGCEVKGATAVNDSERTAVCVCVMEEDERGGWSGGGTRHVVAVGFGRGCGDTWGPASDETHQTLKSRPLLKSSLKITLSPERTTAETPVADVSASASAADPFTMVGGSSAPLEPSK